MFSFVNSADTFEIFNLSPCISVSGGGGQKYKTLFLTCFLTKDFYGHKNVDFFLEISTSVIFLFIF